MQTLLAFLLTLGVLVTVHEYGHYRMARACGVKVLRFSIGFGRVLWRFQRPGGTEFVVAALPLGGYVRMLDERDGQVDAADLPHAFNRRPLWQRALIVAAGPVANLALAVLMYAAAQFNGLEAPVARLGTPPRASLLADAGAQAGDRVLAFAADPDGTDAEPSWHEVRSFDDLEAALAEARLDGRAVRLRLTGGDAGSAGATRDIRLPLDTLDTADSDRAAWTRIGLGAPYMRPVLGQIVPDGPAARAGLRSGDEVLRVDGRPVADAQALRDLIRASARSMNGRGDTPPAMRWELMRNGATMALEVQPRVVDGQDEGEGGRIGRVDAAIGAPYETVRVADGALDSLAVGARRTLDNASNSLRMLGRMLVGQVSLDHLSGPLTIADVAGRSAGLGLSRYLEFLAVVSVGLGVLNLLPLPLLDGGLLMYYLFEGATGRPVSELWQNRLQRGGAMILLLLISLALSNDVARLLGLH